jgi:hypothetical protein
LSTLKSQSEGTCVDATPRRQLVFKGYFKPPEWEVVRSKV